MASVLNLQGLHGATPQVRAASTISVASCGAKNYSSVSVYSCGNKAGGTV